MGTMEKTLQTVREYLPAPGTKLGEFIFLNSDTLWTGEMEKGSFVAVAEDRWSLDSGMFLMVMADGAVYVADLENNQWVSYCAASFTAFMEMMKLYLYALETIPDPDGLDDEGMEKCVEAEKILRQKMMEIDPSAIEDTENFWSTLIEEIGAGM